MRDAKVVALHAGPWGVDVVVTDSNGIEYRYVTPQAAVTCHKLDKGQRALLRALVRYERRKV